MNPPTPIDQFLNAHLSKRAIPGASFAIVHKSEIVKRYTYGIRSIETNVPVTHDTAFFAASISKPVTAVAVLTLVQQGQLALSDRIVDLLPGSPAHWKDITVRHLLTHTAGFPDTPTFDDSKALYTRDELFALYKETKLPAVPGEVGIYNNIGYALLGMILGQLSGKTFAAFMDENIFRPLGMNATFYIGEPPVTDNVAMMYTRQNGITGPLTMRSNVALTCGYGLRMPIGDLCAWDTALSNGKLIAPALMKEMSRPVTGSNGHAIEIFRQHYGLGWYLNEFDGHATLEHNGVTGTFYMRVPALDTSVMFFTNLEDTVEPKVVAQQALRIYRETAGVTNMASP